VRDGRVQVGAAEVAEDMIVVRAAGVFDEDAATRLRDALFPMVCADGVHVLLDLGEARLVDTASVAVIAAAARMSRRRGAGLAVVACPGLERRLDDSGVGDLLHFEDSVAGWLGR
jgi:anti-anti-sigma factor